MTIADELSEWMVPLSSALSADGYSLEGKMLAARHIRLEVRAGAEACSDCLVPRDLFEKIAAQRLPDNGRGWTIQVVYPTDGTDDSQAATR